MKLHGVLGGWLLGGVLLGISMAGFAAPPASHPETGPRAQLKEVEAQIAAAQAHQAALHTRLEKLEQQNAAQHAQLQQRDAEIAALRQKLAAAGVPASAASAGP